MPPIEEILRVLRSGGNPWVKMPGQAPQSANPLGTYIRGEPGAVGAPAQTSYLPQSYAGQDETTRMRLAAELTGKLLGAPMAPGSRAGALQGMRSEIGNPQDFMREIESRVGANLERKNPVTLQPYVPKDFRKEFSHIQAIPEKTGMGGTTIPAYGTPSKQEMAQYRALREVWPVESAPPNQFLSSVFQRYR